MPTGTEEYYAQRAAEYDQLYPKPERQKDIATAGHLVENALAGCDVIDIAAGTGFWTERFDAAFVGFFWSHMKLGQLGRFLDGVVRRLEPGTAVVIVDNNYVEGSNHPIERTDENGNTYQRRRLTDGREWEVRKNFPTTESRVAMSTGTPCGHSSSPARPGPRGTSPSLSYRSPTSRG